MTVMTPSDDDILEIHKLVGELKGLVQHPVHFYKIIINYFGNSFFIIKEADRIIGLGWGFVSQSNRNIFFLWQIGVLKEFRGKNIANRLIEKLIKFAKDNNCKKVHATVETGNIASWKMFEKMDFKNVSKGNIIFENGKKAIVNYYGSGTNQILYEYKL